MNLFSTKPPWAYSNYLLMSKLFDKNGLRIFFLENLDHNYDALKFFTSNDFLLVSIGCYFDEYNFRLCKYIVENINPNIDKKKIIFFANECVQKKMAIDNGFNAIDFNQNALINRDIFKPVSKVDKIYNIVLNTRPDIIKRPWLAAEITDIAIIKGYSYVQDRFWNLESLSPAFINEDRLSPERVNFIYNSSLMGGIFSEREGANYATGEYLLSGIPVLSTFSSGGRQEWLDDSNSILCNPDPYEIKMAADLVIERIKYGQYLSADIRAGFIERSDKYITNLASLFYDLSDVLKLSNSDIVELLIKIRTKKIEKHLISSFEKSLFS